MMRRKTTRGPRRTPLLALLVLITCVGAILSTPLAASKYVSTGVGRAKARYARFEPEWRLQYSFTSPGSITTTMTGGGFVMHPDSWYVPTSRTGGSDGGRWFVSLWRFINKSEVTVNARYRLMSYQDKDPQATAHGGYAVGEYVHSTRTELNPATNFGTNVGVGGAWMPGWINSQWENGEANPLTGVNYPPNGTTVGTLCHLYLQGLTAYPIRPANSKNAAGASFTGATNSVTNGSNISKSDPIRFGVGSWSIDGMKTKWWRTYRVNIDLVAEQVD